MEIEDIEILIDLTEIGINSMSKGCHSYLVERVKKAGREDLLERLQKIKPYKPKGETE